MGFEGFSGYYMDMTNPYEGPITEKDEWDPEDLHINRLQETQDGLDELLKRQGDLEIEKLAVGNIPDQDAQTQLHLAKIEAELIEIRAGLEKKTAPKA